MISYQLYKIIIERNAQKYLNSLNEVDRKKIVLKIQALTSSDTRHLPIKKLQGYKNLYRLRVDDYRVIFVVVSDKKILLIAVVGHRKEVYDIVKKMKF